MSMRVERSNVDQVRKRIELNKAKQTEVEKEYNFEERMKELKEEVRLCNFSIELIFLFVFSLGRKNESSTTRQEKREQKTQGGRTTRLQGTSR